MTDVFVAPRTANGFDRLDVDVARLYETYPLAHRTEWRCAAPRPARGAYSSRSLPLNVRLNLWKLLHRLRLDIRWFDNFQAYWTSVLGGRPLLSPDDFHFLRGVYRLRHQDNQVPDTSNPAVHVAAWQQPELLYQLFSQVFLESLHPRIGAAEWLWRLRVRSFCEYGCATAPVAWAYRQFFGAPGRAYLVDLATVSLHYAAYRFRREAAFEPVALDPMCRLLPPEGVKVDAIVCLTVFEHLLDPLDVAHRFVEMLAPAGHLVFDYFAADGRGLDTRQGAEQREAVLKFVADRFHVVHGNAAAGQLTVARLR